MHLAPEIDKACVKSIAVVDFVDAADKPTDLGWYLANKLSDSLVIKGPAIVVVDRTRLQQLRLASVDPRSADTLKQIGTTDADTVVAGKVEITAEQIRAHRDDAESVGRLDYHICRVLSSTLAHPRSSQPGWRSRFSRQTRARRSHGGWRTCVSLLSHSGRHGEMADESATKRILSVTISIAGAAEKISVVRSPGYFLSERAIEAVSEWKFRPAPGEDGKPTTVIVPIEVTFKTSRT